MMTVASAALTVVTAAITAAAGLLGVLAGSLATARRERAARREDARRELSVAALRCLARVRKIEAAIDDSGEAAEKERENELYLLGGDLDTYVVAIAGVEDRATRTRHWKIYERAAPTLVGRDRGKVRATAEALEQVRRELMEDAPGA
jgi:hypothetical protein